MERLIYIFLLFSVYRQSVLADLLVTLPNGQIRGHELQSPNGTIFYAYQGVPFAKPPLGELRFQAPVPPDNWEGILEATKESSRCYSKTENQDGESEDCLTINVYTPVLDPESGTKLPVMVYFYGGGFRGGAASYNIYGPDFLIEQDVIVVQPNYRVGPFGFLSTGDEVIPGNAGLKDQVLALKWVQQNIGLFGGDPTQVTIFGQSAGAASVGYQILSKQSTGLFRAAIAESGSALSIWAFLKNPSPYGYELAGLIDSSVTPQNSTALLQYLQSVTAEQIDIASTKTVTIDHPLPVIEVEHDGAFITKEMYESLEAGDINKVPLLMGANSEEYISIAEDMDLVDHYFDVYEHYKYKLVPESFNIEDQDMLEEIGEAIKEIYIKDGSEMKTHPGKCITYMSDNHYLKPCVKHAELQSKYTDVYFYIFSYAGVMGSNLNITLEGAEKVTHSEELKYYFRQQTNQYDNSDLSKFPAADVLVHNRMVNMWTNFAKTMNPTPEKTELLQNIIWPKVEPDNIQYVDIGENLVIKTTPKGERYLGWKALFDKWAVRPHTTF